MRKTGVILKIAAGLWVLTAVTTALMGLPAIAKYTAGATANATGTVAKFDPVWIPVNDSNSAEGGYGSLDSGFVVAPNTSASAWTTVRWVDWRNTNEGDVRIKSYLVPKLTTGLQEGDRSVGVYSPLSNPARQDFTTTVFQSGVAAGHNTGTVSWSQTGTSASPREVALNSSVWFYYSFTPASAAPGRPTGDQNSSTITRAAPIRFAAGSNTVSNMRTTYWRTYRVNADAFDTQID